MSIIVFASLLGTCGSRCALYPGSNCPLRAAKQTRCIVQSLTGATQKPTRCCTTNTIWRYRPRTGPRSTWHQIHRIVRKRCCTWGICTRRAGKLYKARFQVYRSQILQVNSKYSLESSRRDLHNALLCTVLNAQFIFIFQKSLKILPIFPPNFAKFRNFR